MNKWVWLLVLSLVFSGCSGGKNADKAKTQSNNAAKKTKSQSSNAGQKTKSQGTRNAQNDAVSLSNEGVANPTVAGNQSGNANTKKAAILNMHTNKQDVVLFLNRAEHVFEDVHFAALSMPNGKTLREDGYVYRELPSHLDSKEKVISYFSTYWSHPVALKMYDNLPTRTVNGKLYVAQKDRDYPVLISNRNTAVQVVKDQITAKVDNITAPTFARDRTVRYRLIRDQKTKRYEINQRIGAYGNEMFK